MAQNIIFILTEGDHDSAFIYRILKANGFTTYSKLIKEFPKPLDAFLATDILNVTIDEVKVQEARTRFLPSYVLTLGNNTVLLYSVGGDSKSDIRIPLIKTINAFNVQDPDAIQALKDTSISVLYFLDADDLGIAARTEQVKAELNSAFTKSQAPEIFIHSTIYTIEDLKVGAYIFSEAGTDKGLLEDILIPLMRQGNDDIFNEADKFITSHENTVLFKGKQTVTDGVVKKVNGQKFSYKKSLIGTVGQLQKSGKSNTVCISDADYLDNGKITGNATCVAIHQFIQQVMI